MLVAYTVVVIRATESLPHYSQATRTYLPRDSHTTRKYLPHYSLENIPYYSREYMPQYSEISFFVEEGIPDQLVARIPTPLCA